SLRCCCCGRLRVLLCLLLGYFLILRLLAREPLRFLLGRALRRFGFGLRLALHTLRFALARFGFLHRLASSLESLLLFRFQARSLFGFAHDALEVLLPLALFGLGRDAGLLFHLGGEPRRLFERRALRGVVGGFGDD